MLLDSDMALPNLRGQVIIKRLFIIVSKEEVIC